MNIRIGVIGAGAMGSHHIRVLREWPESRISLVGVADNDTTQLARAVRRYTVKGYHDYRIMVERTEPQLVAVAVPTEKHYEIARYLLEHGMHVLMEKPIAETVAQAEELIALAAEKKLKLAVGHIERFNPAITLIKQHIREQALGQIYLLSARRLGPFPPRRADIGVTLDLATHEIDIMRFLTDSEIASFSGTTQQRVHQHHEDLLIGMLHFANGSLGMLDINWLTPHKIRELSITGEKGMFRVNYLTQDVFWHKHDYVSTTWDALSSLTGGREGTLTRLPVPKAEPLYVQYENIFRALATDQEPMVTGQDGLKALKVALELAGTPECFVAHKDYSHDLKVALK